MTRVVWRVSVWLVGCAALVSSACSAPTACGADASTLHPTGVKSSPLSGSVLLSNAGESAIFGLDVTLAGLPTLWPAYSAIKDAGVGVSVKLAYTTPPLGGDGNTQMPRLRVRLDQQPGTTTSSFTSGFEGTNSTVFENCGLLGAEHCCAFGSKECQAHLQVTIQRLDGAPFPPVQATWTAGAGATISSCPEDLDTPTFTVTSDAP